jgi:hypothetical protein
VQDRLVVLLPQAWGEWRDRGLAHAERGNVAQAVSDLQTYLAHVEDGLDVAAIADRNRASELNPPALASGWRGARSAALLRQPPGGCGAGIAGARFPQFPATAG